MANNVIGSIKVSPDKPRPGETVKVEVLDKGGASLEGRAGVSVFINGVPGAIQYLQYPAKGRRTIIARATGASGYESMVLKVNVDGEPVTIKRDSKGSPGQVAMMRVRQSFTCPYEVTFMLGDASREPPMTDVMAGRMRPRTNDPDAQKAEQILSRIRPRDDLTRAVLDRVRRMPPGRVGVKQANVRNQRTGGSKVVSSLAIDMGPGGVEDLLKDNRGRPNRYEWDFGDGTRETTLTPHVTHDYSPSITPGDQLLRFNVTCRSASDDVAVTRTLVLHSAYAMCKSRGTVVPLARGEAHTMRAGPGHQSEFNLINVEDAPITITHQAIMPTFDDDTIDPGVPKFKALSKPISLPASSETLFGVYSMIGYDIPKNASGITVYLAGHTADNKPVRLTIPSDIPVQDQMDMAKFKPPLTRQPWPWQYVPGIVNEITNGARINPAWVAVDHEAGIIAITAPRTTWSSQRAALGIAAQGIVRAGMVAAKMQASAVHSPVVQGASLPNVTPVNANVAQGIGVGGGQVKTDGGTASQPQAVPMKKTLDPPPTPGPVKEGEICDPENISDADLALADEKQLACTLTTEGDDYLIPGKFVNAEKGNIVLSPGGMGMISLLLQALDPPQKYSHTGIMTRNYDEITHSTASDKRIQDYRVGWETKDGFRPDVLKYLWPGAITQSVETAVYGEAWVDPENKKSYWIGPFTQHPVGFTMDDTFVVVPPLVVKPDPTKETQAARDLMHKIADDARSMGGTPETNSKSHYRFYCYTDPTIYKDSSKWGSDSSGWAKGTVPSVCSSFIWLNARKNSARLESSSATVKPTDLEGPDVAGGAEVGSGTQDGLYLYTAAERLAAGQAVYDDIYNMVYDTINAFEEFISDAADNYASQVVNTFACDDVFGKDSNEWQDATSSSAVSPDNILWWDGPDSGGLYGYSEPLLYREPRVEHLTISRWTKSPNRGKVVCTVTHGGKPVSGATVYIYGGKNATPVNGHYELDEVRFGIYEVVARKTIDGVNYEGSVNLYMDHAVETVSIGIYPPADKYRLLKLTVNLTGLADGDVYMPGMESCELELSPDRETNQTWFSYVKNDVYYWYEFDASYHSGDSITLKVTCTINAGDGDDWDDLFCDNEIVWSRSIPKDKTIEDVIIIASSKDDDSWGMLMVVAENARNVT